MKTENETKLAQYIQLPGGGFLHVNSIRCVRPMKAEVINGKEIKDRVCIDFVCADKAEFICEYFNDPKDFSAFMKRIESFLM